MNYKDSVIKVAKELNLSEEFVDKVYKAYWITIRDYMSSLPLKENLTEEELTGLTDLEVVHRIFSQSPATLRKELEHLEKSLTKK